MLYPFFDILTESMTEESFLRDVCLKYHFEEPQLPLLATVAVSMQTRILRDVREGRAGFCGGESQENASDSPQSLSHGKAPQENRGQILTGACITLGPGIDARQEEYLRQELLSEAYMVETIAAELLLRAYPLWNEWLAGRSAYHVKRYYFPGSGEEHPLEELPGLLAGLGAPVTCTGAYCLLPRKSVAFYAELTEESDAVCEGICLGCGSRDCPNRMEKQDRISYASDMTDRLFPYGYLRIFGLD